jgi:hypothetical protein
MWAISYKDMVAFGNTSHYSVDSIPSLV